MSGPVPDDKRPLPDGWIRQWDSNQNHFFYVDTRATPPRAIWTHPLDDPEYQRSHKKDAAPSYSGYLAPPGPPPSGSQSNPELGHKRNDSKDAKRGAFTKLKDKLIGTKEEREAERRAEQQRREQERLQREQLMRERIARLQQQRQSAPAGYYQQGPGGHYQHGPAYQQGPFGQPQYIVQQQPQRSGFGGGGGMGMGMPLLGGLAGGLLLGSALDAGDGGFGGGDGGGDFGGGDMGGGDMGGGDFGGGDF